MARTVNLESPRGGDVVLTIPVTDPYTGLPTNVTGWGGNYVLKAAFSGPALVTQAWVVTDGPGGILTVTLTGVLTMSAGDYLWGAGRTDVGSKDVVVKGKWTLFDNTVL